VRINGESRTVPAGLSVRALLLHLGLSPRVVAVELNREVVEPDKLDDVMVNAGDEMEIVHFVGGG
jgi:thiamine biosynthesis protein ThiS